LSDPRDYAVEAEHHWSILKRHSRVPIETMLELGCGGGNNALYLKRHAAMVLSDISPGILAVSRALNPECAHVQADMRTMRLGREFDAVFVHDSIMYMRTEADLRQAIMTAFVHCRRGGVALFVPDCVKETWAPYSDMGGRDGEARGLRYLEWAHDPDPSDTEFAVEMVFLLKENGREARAEHERHQFGLFARETWARLFANVGFTAVSEPCAYSGGERAVSFVGIKSSG
jgi:SAM-dependent methyltransferase